MFTSYMFLARLHHMPTFGWFKHHESLSPDVCYVSREALPPPPHQTQASSWGVRASHDESSVRIVSWPVRFGKIWQGQARNGRFVDAIFGDARGLSQLISVGIASSWYNKSLCEHCDIPWHLSELSATGHPATVAARLPDTWRCQHCNRIFGF